MNEEKTKTIPLNPESSQSDKKENNFAQDIVDNVKRDMGKAALIVSMLTLVIAVILYFSLQSNMAGLNQEVSELSSVTNEVNRLDSTVSDIESRLNGLEQLPRQTRNLVYMNMLNEMEQKAGYMSQNLDGDQKEKLSRAKQLLQEVNNGMKTTLE